MKFSLGPDYGWLNTIALHDQPQPNTNNLAILPWLVQMGVEIDPHCHEAQYKNSADVANLIIAAGGVPSSIASGRIYQPPTYEDWEPLRNPVVPKSPGNSWTASGFWGAASRGHGASDDNHTTIWYPTSSSQWTTNHSPSLYYIGNGNITLAGAQELINNVLDGDIQCGLFTTAIMIDPVKFIGVKDGVTVEQLCEFSSFVHQYPFVSWLNLQEINSVWQSYNYCTVEDIISSNPCC